MNRFIHTSCGPKPTNSVFFSRLYFLYFILKRDIYEALHFYSDISPLSSGLHGHFPRKERQ